MIPFFPVRAAGASAEAASLASVSRDHVVRVLERTRGNKKAAAELLGVSRRALYRLLERLELDESIRKRPDSGESSF